MYSEERTKELRKVSGTITYADPLTSFLYQLMRDHLPAGEVEKLVTEVASEAENIVFTNGWLAQYANNLAEQLKAAKTNQLSETLSKIFKDGDEDEDEYNLSPERPSFNTQKDIEDELENLREEIENAEKEDTPESLVLDAIDESKKEEENDEPPVTLEQARAMVEEMVSKGVLSDEKTKEIQEGLEEIEKEAAEEDGRTSDTEE